MKPHKQSQDSTYKFTLGFCVNLKPEITGTIEGKDWLSFALDLIGNRIQTASGKVKEGHIRGTECQ